LARSGIDRGGNRRHEDHATARSPQRHQSRTTVPIMLVLGVYGILMGVAAYSLAWLTTPEDRCHTLISPLWAI
jgi:hypothetical protein